MARVYLLIFEEGRENEKICSLVLGQYRIIPLFQSEEEAYRYSLLLQGRGLALSKIISVETTDLLNYAKTTGYSFQLISKRATAVSPKEKSELVEWFTSFSPTQLSRVYILLFNLGKETEGIHSLKIANYDIVLLFETEDDATRYSLLLEAQDFPTPTVEMMYIEDAIESCSSAGYAWQIVKKEGIAMPPEQNLQETDWQQEQKEEEKDSAIPENDLDNIRRKLEGLL